MGGIQEGAKSLSPTPYWAFCVLSDVKVSLGKTPPVPAWVQGTASLDWLTLPASP